MNNPDKQPPQDQNPAYAKTQKLFDRLRQKRIHQKNPVELYPSREDGAKANQTSKRETNTHDDNPANRVIRG